VSLAATSATLDVRRTTHGGSGTGEVAQTCKPLVERAGARQSCRGAETRFGPYRFGCMRRRRSGRFSRLPAPAEARGGRSADPGGDCAVAKRPSRSDRPCLLSRRRRDSDASPFSRPDQTQGLSAACEQGTCSGGWVLSSVWPRESDPQESRPDRTSSCLRSGRSGLYCNPRHAPRCRRPPAGGPGSYAPFVPRSTAEERASDGFSVAAAPVTRTPSAAGLRSGPSTEASLSKPLRITTSSAKDRRRASEAVPRKGRCSGTYEKPRRRIPREAYRETRL